MRTCCVKNGLVMVVILLFIGVAVQPSIAVNPNSSDNKDDCNLCAKKVSKPYLVLLKSLINRAETLNNKLSVISKFHPKLTEEYQELLDKITTLKEMNKEYISDVSWDFPVICNIVSFLIVYQLLTMIM